MKKLLVLFLILTVAVLAACSNAPNLGPDLYFPAESLGGYTTATVTGGYQHEDIVENGFSSTSDVSTSYFSLDRNTASYSIMRRQINDGMKIAAGSVRLEEYVNYFSYSYERPQQGEALAISGSLFNCPWNANHKLLTVGVAAEEVTFEKATPNNLVFLIDTSGSMYGSDRLPLIQQAFTMLTENLADDDFVSIVTYAGDSRIALDGARGSEKLKIANVLQDLTASGSTNGSGGIEKAYALAQKYFVEGGNNRVILATDGDFNVGISNPNELKSYISQKRQSGIFLSVLGVGMFNTNDTTMKTLAENGNGNYAYLDSVTEARKVLIKEINGTFHVAAKDAKIGVQFNSDVVESFRLIGYESKNITQEEFNDEQKDAGEIGSGHTVTAVYEIALKDGQTGEIATAEIRYKNPHTDQSNSVSKVFTTDMMTVAETEDNTFVGCVVEFGLLLRNSDYKADATFGAVVARLQMLDSVVGNDADPFRKEFLLLVQKAAELYA